MKIIGYVFIAIIALSLINFWFQVYVAGRYYANAGLFLSIIGALCPVVIIYISYLLIKRIKNH